MSTIDNLNALIDQLVSLRNDLETAEQEGCGCTPNTTCEICLAENRIKKAMELGFGYDLAEIENEIKAGMNYQATPQAKAEPKLQSEIDRIKKELGF